MDITVNNFWFGLGVHGFSEKSSPRMEIPGTREEEKSSLAAGSNLFILVYLGKRNQRTFEDEELLDQRLKDLFLQSLVEWSQQFLDLEISSHLNFLEALYCS